MKKVQTIGFRLLILGIIIPLVLFLVISFYLVYTFASDQYNFETTTLNLETDILESELLLEIKEQSDLLNMVGTLPVTQEAMREMPDTLDWEQFGKYELYETLQSILGALSSDPSVALLYVAAENSKGFIANREPALPDWYDARERPWYTDSVDGLEKGRSFYISPPYLTAEEGAAEELATTIAMPVKDPESGNLLGVVAMDYNISEIIARLEESQDKHNEEIRLYIREEGILIWSEDYGLIDMENPVTIQDLAEEYQFNDLRGKSREEIVSQLTSETESFSFEGDIHKGTKGIFIYKRIESTPWSMLISIPRDRVYEKINKQVLIPIGVMILIFLISSVLGFFIISRSINKPLRLTVWQLDDLNSGDADLTHRLDLNLKDEIGQMTGKFDQFLDTLHRIVKEVDSTVTGTAEVKDQLVASTEETSASLEEISANMDSMEKQVKSLDDNILSSVASIEEITANIDSVDNQINDQASMVEESTAAITEMISSLESVSKIVDVKRQATAELANIADKGQEMLKHSSETFRQVADQIGAIQEMANTINSISAQTNLLSMNAAIEAAHAGQAGLGFAVVAEEIRNLADSARKSSGNISQNIKEITGSVEATSASHIELERAFLEVVKEVKDTVNAFHEIEQSVQELNTGGKQVLQASTEINNVTLHIRSGSSEIKEGTNRLLDGASEMKQISTQITGGSREVNTGTKEIITSMQLLVELSTRLDGIVNELNKTFGQFKI